MPRLFSKILFFREKKERKFDDDDDNDDVGEEKTRIHSEGTRLDGCG